MQTENTQAVLLLTCYFSKPKKDEVKPLTVAEYARFAEWLRGNGYSPSSLFHDLEAIFSKWLDPKKTITADRVKGLLGRGMAMGLALEKWNKSGIWLLTRSDKEYPVRLKKRLGTMSPPVIFGVGSKPLLDAGGLAVVGSRGIGEEDSQYTQTIGSQAASEGVNIVSGGARGVDETSMLSALEAGGTATGILADSLLKAALSGKWRRHLQQGNLVLISTYYPEAGFNAGNAMGRNKYIYCLSDHSLIVRSDKDKGGTWAGAIENLSKGWVPLFVRPSDVDGNCALLQMAGHPLELSEHHSESWLTDALNRSAFAAAQTVSVQTQSADLFLMEGTHSSDSYSQNEVQPLEVPEPDLIQEQESLPKSGNDPFFHLFTEKLKELLNTKPDISLTDLKLVMGDLNAKQITEWLDRAESEKLVERKGRTRTYQLAS